MSHFAPPSDFSTLNPLPWYFYQENKALHQYQIVKLCLRVIQQYILSVQTIQCYLTSFESQHWQWLTSEQLKQLDLTSAKKTDVCAKVLKKLPAAEVIKKTEEEQSRYFAICGLGDLAQFNKDYHKKVVNGDIFPLTAEHIATLSPNSAYLIDSRTFKKLKLEQLMAFSADIVEQFQSFQNKAFVKAYFSTTQEINLLTTGVLQALDKLSLEEFIGFDDQLQNKIWMCHKECIEKKLKSCASNFRTSAVERLVKILSPANLRLINEDLLGEVSESTLSSLPLDKLDVLGKFFVKRWSIQQQICFVKNYFNQSINFDAFKKYGISEEFVLNHLDWSEDVVKMLEGQHFDLLSLRRRCELIHQFEGAMSVAQKESFCEKCLSSEKQKIEFAKMYFELYPEEHNLSKLESLGIPRALVIDHICLTQNHIKTFTKDDLNAMSLGAIASMSPEAIFQAMEKLKEIPTKEIQIIKSGFYSARFAYHHSSENLPNDLTPTEVKSENYETNQPNKSSLQILKGFEDPSRGIGFVNGIMNAIGDEQSGFFGAVHYISRMAWNYQVHGVHSATNGLVWDLLRCRAGLNGVATETVRYIHTLWDDFFDKRSQDAEFLMICHSRGAIDVRNALLSYKKLDRRSRIRVVAVAPGAYIDPGTCKSVTHLTVSFDPVTYADRANYEKALQADTVQNISTTSGAHKFKAPVYGNFLEQEIRQFLGEKILEQAFNENVLPGYDLASSWDFSQSNLSSSSAISNPLEEEGMLVEAAVEQLTKDEIDQLGLNWQTLLDRENQSD